MSWGWRQIIFCKTLLLMYMYTESFTRCDVNQFRTLLWTNEYELQFHSHDDAKHTCAKMQWTMGANVHPPIPIKSTIHVGANLGPSLGGVRKNLDFQQNCKVFKRLSIGS